MRLIDLWHALLAKASEEEQALALHFHPHIEALDATVAPALPPAEYPKWVGGVVVDDAAAEAALRVAPAAAAPAPAPVTTAPVADGPAAAAPEGAH